LEKQVETLAGQLEAQFDVQQTTGQGDAVFSWDIELTKAFPADAKMFEKVIRVLLNEWAVITLCNAQDLHGGFNEDPATGIVYTGVPGYGLCQISPDLKTWTKIGTDERLKGNCHGIVVFTHNGETNIAVAQNEQARVLIIGLDGTVKHQLDAPKGGEFDFDEANAYYSQAPRQQCPWGPAQGMFSSTFDCTDVTYHDGKLFVVTGYSNGNDFICAG
jgi:hypothetical protein